MPACDISAHRACFAFGAMFVSQRWIVRFEMILHAGCLCVTSISCESSRYTEWSLAARRHYVRAVCGVFPAMKYRSSIYLRPYCSNTFTVTLPYPFCIFCTAVVHMYLYHGFRISCNSPLRNALCPCAKFECRVIVSCETWRQTAYDEDLRWRMMWQREALAYAIASSNLNVNKATVLRTT